METTPQEENSSKNLMPYAIVVAAFLIASAIVYVFLNKNLPAGVKPEPASIVQSEDVNPEPQNPAVDVEVLEVLAKCLKEKGAKFYGASWCGYCKKQKELFGEASQYLPYVECINPETEQLTEECQNVNIEGFPTWEFPEKGLSVGFQTLEDLSQLSGCPLGEL